MTDQIRPIGGYSTPIFLSLGGAWVKGTMIFLLVFLVISVTGCSHSADDSSGATVNSLANTPIKSFNVDQMITEKNLAPGSYPLTVDISDLAEINFSIKKYIQRVTGYHSKIIPNLRTGADPYYPSVSVPPDMELPSDLTFLGETSGVFCLDDVDVYKSQTVQANDELIKGILHIMEEPIKLYSIAYYVSSARPKRYSDHPSKRRSEYQRWPYKGKPCRYFFELPEAIPPDYIQRVSRNNEEKEFSAPGSYPVYLNLGLSSSRYLSIILNYVEDKTDIKKRSTRLTADFGSTSPLLITPDVEIPQDISLSRGARMICLDRFRYYSYSVNPIVGHRFVPGTLHITEDPIYGYYYSYDRADKKVSDDPDIDRGPLGGRPCWHFFEIPEHITPDYIQNSPSLSSSKDQTDD